MITKNTCPFIFSRPLSAKRSPTGSTTSRGETGGRGEGRLGEASVSVLLPEAAPLLEASHLLSGAPQVCRARCSQCSGSAQRLRAGRNTRTSGALRPFPSNSAALLLRSLDRRVRTAGGALSSNSGVVAGRGGRVECSPRAGGHRSQGAYLGHMVQKLARCARFFIISLLPLTRKRGRFLGIYSL